MPPRHSFWVILIGKTATSFRGKEREDLVPTLRQLQRTQNDVTLRWFERGRIWESPQAAIGAAKLAATEAGARREKRTKEWRPGGEHRDPKARFELTRDEKRAKFKRDRIRESDSPFKSKPPGDERPARQRDQAQSPPPDERRPRQKDRAERSPFEPRQRTERPNWRERPERRERPEQRERPERRERPSGSQMQNPFKDQRGGRPERSPFSGRPGRTGDRGGFKPPKRRP